MKGEIINFFTRDGLQLYGFWNSAKSRVGVIFIHGLTGNFYWKNFLSVFSEATKRNKIGFLSFDNRGAGLITKFYKKKGKKIIGTDFEKFEECVYDIGAAVSFLGKKGCRKIFLAGHSTGCQKSVYYMAKTRDKRIAGIVLLGPADDYNLNKKQHGKDFKKLVALTRKMISSGKGNEEPKYKKRIYYSAQRLNSLIDLKRPEARIFNYDLDLEFVKKNKVPMLAVFGSKEEYAIRSQQKMLEKIKSAARASCETLLVKGANHSFVGKEKIVSNKIVNWIEKFV